MNKGEILYLVGDEERYEEFLTYRTQKDCTHVDAVLFCGSEPVWSGEIEDRIARSRVVILELSDHRAQLDGTRRIRQVSGSRGILILDGEASDDREQECLACGADDYQPLCRPGRVLAQRIRNLWMREQGLSPARIFGGLLQCTGLSDYWARGQRLGLTRLEYQVLELLVDGAGQVVPRKKLLENIWGTSGHGTRSLDTMVKQLRRKLHGSGVTIVAQYGKGYQMKQTEDICKEKNSDVPEWREI